MDKPQSAQTQYSLNAMKERQTAREAAEAFFGDLLTPEPKKTAKQKAQSAVKVWRETATPHNLVRLGGFKPLARLYTITRQECSGCGSVHTYTATQLIRFAAQKRRDGLALELPTILTVDEINMELPIHVHRVDETTPVCATCLAISDLFDYSIESYAQQHFEQRQLTLFI